MKKRADGRYTKNLRHNGQRVYIYGETKEEVEEKYWEMRRKIDFGFMIKDTATVGEFAIEWYSVYIKDKRSQKTQEMYKSIINNHIAPFAHLKLKEIRPIMVERYLNEIDGSKSLIQKIKITFKQIMDAAVANKIITENPITSLKVIAPDTPKREVLSTNERLTVLDALEDYPGYLWVYTLLNTGLREGEALALTWNDFDEVSGVLSVNKALEFKNAQPIIKEPKTKAGIRKIPVPLDLKELLIQEKTKSNSLYIFHKQNGALHSQTSSANMWRRIKAILDNYLKANPDAPRIHLTYRLLRHTYATALFDANIDIKSAQELLGHSDFKITMDIYTHIQSERRFQTQLKMENLYVIPNKTTEPVGAEAISSL